MSRNLRLGFVALNDAAPLIVAKEKGFFTAEGLDVELQREPSWANIRDKLSAGEVQGAHMLASMVLASTMGSGSEPRAMIVPLGLNHNGSAFTVSTALHQAMAGRRLKDVVKERAEAGLPLLRFAVVFPYSIHNYQLRDWLAVEGVDPERDVRMVVIPPPRMAEQLKAGVMDGFCVGEPWNAMAEAEGTGVILWRATEVRPNAPDKVLGVTQDWAEAEPALLADLVRAIAAAEDWADDPANRRELAELLSRPHYVDAPAELIEASLEGMAFAAAGRPNLEYGLWFLTQMQRWGQVPPLASPGPLAEKVYRIDLYDEALAGRRP